MFETFLQYYGLDWIGMGATFFSLWWLGDKHWSGFLVGALASVCWAGFGLMTGSGPAFFANVVFFFVNVRGAYKWYKESN
jgi:hypothetical protein